MNSPPFFVSLDPTTTAVVAAALLGIQGVVAYANPTSCLKNYGVPHSKLAVLLMRRIASSAFLFLVAAYCTLIRDMDLIQTTGYTSLVWLVEFVRTALLDDAESLGLSNHKGTYVLTALYAFICVSTLLANTSVADFAVKFHVVRCLVDGLYMIVKPAGAVDLWGSSRQSNDGAIFTMRVLGFYLLAVAAFFGSQVLYGIAPATAFGYVWLVFGTLMLTTNHITKEVEKFSMDKRKQYFWMVVQAVSIFAILVQGDSTLSFATTETING